VSIVNGWSLVIPAQLTTAVTGPSSSCVRSNQALTDVRLDRGDPGAEFGSGLLDPAGGQRVLAVAEADVPAVRGQLAHGGRPDAVRAVADQRDPGLLLAQRLTLALIRKRCRSYVARR
jgi:hypothetical protein